MKCLKCGDEGKEQFCSMTCYLKLSPEEKMDIFRYGTLVTAPLNGEI